MTFSFPVFYFSCPAEQQGLPLVSTTLCWPIWGQAALPDRQVVSATSREVGWLAMGENGKQKQNLAYGHKHERETVMQSSARWGKTVATAGIHVRLCEKAPSRFSSGKPSAYRPQVCLWKIFWELSHKAFSHGSLPGHVFYLTYLRPASLFIPHIWTPQCSTLWLGFYM